MAIEALDQIGCYHRDIKPQNIVIKKNGHICLIDFGVSELAASATVQGSVGTTGFIAPEIDAASMRDRNGARIADIFSFGVVLEILAEACVSTPREACVHLNADL